MLLRIQLSALIETEDALEVGAPIAILEFDEEDFEVFSETKDLALRLENLLEKETFLQARSSSRGGIAYESPEFGTEAWTQALLDRLEQKDFRLYGEIL